MERFDCYPYFENIHASLKDLESFKFCRVSDKNTLEELISNSRTSNAFFALMIQKTDKSCRLLVAMWNAGFILSGS